MITLEDFNRLEAEQARAAIAHCVALPAWQQALVAARPFASRSELFAQAQRLMVSWQAADLDRALGGHPRIGERAVGSSRAAALSRGEQASLSDSDAATQAALRQGNADYEARFGRVFLIRAKGRSAQAMLTALRQRLTLSPQQELAEALAQLRDITQLRLEETIA
ncbi:2-oxo-4-hydroxy-4-carboxy-5-ureidoimidazoline decarboxylase [Pantoea sp. 1.19]|uniref:2-oxo-4-hydroxy-4-carboxy-5-ureidoimidazoline decarboxylase n=1 Tax=Pantoea sp. 1.19 TaxID=1925589 RepID=UPI000AB2DD90|nr:2-oxo-4-hydroxy-4-carboxy-5-ureidoimidazoline decarboxylase [Pantoea sp. 1.19]